MPKFDRYSQLKLKYAVRDLLVSNPKTDIAIQYIKDTTGIEISARHYNDLRNEIVNDEEMKGWIQQYVSYGYIVEHRRIIDELKIIRDKYWDMISIEEKRPEDTRDLYLLKGLMNQLTQIEVTLSQISLGTPVLAQMKQLVDHYKSELVKNQAERLAQNLPADDQKTIKRRSKDDDDQKTMKQVIDITPRRKKKKNDTEPGTDNIITAEDRLKISQDKALPKTLKIS